MPCDTNSPADGSTRGTRSGCGLWGVIVVGGSSVGKSRCLYEAVTALLDGWWLLHPDHTDRLDEPAASNFTGRVVWLDELQRYLDGSRSRLTAV